MNDVYKVETKGAGSHGTVVWTPAYEARSTGFKSRSRLFFSFQDPFLSKVYFIHVTAGQIATANYKCPNQYKTQCMWER